LVFVSENLTEALGIAYTKSTKNLFKKLRDGAPFCSPTSSRFFEFLILLNEVGAHPSLRLALPWLGFAAHIFRISNTITGMDVLLDWRMSDVGVFVCGSSASIFGVNCASFQLDAVV
jgi:hypothetical protein